MLLVDGNPETLLDRFQSYVPPVIPKWIEQTET
jgi:hypothetical protein